MEESVTGEFPYERTEERVGDEDSRRRSVRDTKGISAVGQVVVAENGRETQTHS